MEVKKKPNNVSSIPIRVDKDILKSLEPLKVQHGSWNKTIKHIFRKLNPDKYYWALPSDIFNTKPQAMGESLKRAIQNGLSPEEREHPLKVSPLDE